MPQTAQFGKKIDIHNTCILDKVKKKYPYHLFVRAFLSCVDGRVQILFKFSFNVCILCLYCNIMYVYCVYTATSCMQKITKFTHKKAKTLAILKYVLL